MRMEKNLAVGVVGELGARRSVAKQRGQLRFALRLTWAA